MAKSKLELIISAVDEASGVFGKIGSGLKVGLAVGAAAAAAGIGMAVAALGDCVQEAMAAEEVTAQLNAVLESTGGKAGVTAEMATSLADSLSQVTRFEDDAILAGENMLLTFTNIGKDVFPAATETMLNMSQALGQDLNTSAIQLGKALNDPINGVTALQRVGVTFTDSQKDMIKSLVETGDVAGAQKIILQELQTEFGNSARAAGETLAGKLEILKNQFGNVKESIGAALIPVLSDLASTYGPKLIEFAQQAGAWIAGTLVPAIQQAATWLGQNLPPVLTAVSALWQNVLKPALEAVWQFIVDSVIPALTTIVAWLAENIPIAVAKAADYWEETLKPALETVWQFISENVIPIIEDVVEWLQTNIPKAIEFARQAWEETLKPALETVWQFISENVIPIIEDVVEWLQTNIPKAIEGAKTAWESLQKPIQAIVDVVTAIVEWFGKTLAKFDDLKTKLAETLPNPFSGIASTAQAVADAIGKAISKLREWLGLDKTGFGGSGAGVAEWPGIGVGEPTIASFGQALTSILGIFTQAVDALNKLRLFEPIGGELLAAVANVANWVRTLAEYLGLVASTVALELQEEAKRFAENAGPVVVAFGLGVDTLSKLRLFEPIGGELLASVSNMAYWLRQLVFYIGLSATTVSTDLQAAAKQLAENAGPVLGVIAGAIAAIGELARWQSFPLVLDTIPKLWALSDHLRLIVLAVAWAASFVATSLQTAAKQFAENAGPVVGLVGNAIKAIAELGRWENIPQASSVLPALGALRDHLRQLVTYIAEAAAYVATNLQAAAKQFAENAGPVVSVVSNTIKAIGDVSGWLPALDAGALRSRVERLAEFLRVLAEELGTQAQALGADVWQAASAFATAAQPVVSVVSGALDLMQQVRDMWALVPAPFMVRRVMGQIDEFFGILITSLSGSAERYAPQVPGHVLFVQALGGLVAALQDLLASLAPLGSLNTAAFAAGRAWITALADGIRSGMSYLEETLALPLGALANGGLAAPVGAPSESNNWYVTVNTNATAGTYLADVEMARALAGA